MPIGVMSFTLFTTKMIQISTVLHIFLTTAFVIVGFIDAWTVSFLTWTISLYTYEYLTDIKQSLILEFNKNSGFD